MQGRLIANSMDVCGYRVRHAWRDAFDVVGFTSIVRNGSSPTDFVSQLRTDGRLEALRACSSVPCRMLGLGSYDPEVAEAGGDHRYSVCIEQTPDTDFSSLESAYRKWIAPTDWLCFEDWKWVAGPYEYLEPLGFRFHTGTYDTGFHFDAFAPGSLMDDGDPFELWITVQPVEEAK